MGKSHSTTTYIIAAMVLGQIVFIFIKSHDQQGWKGRREKEKRRVQEGQLLRVSSERELSPASTCWAFLCLAIR
jgi:hypothetical protein